ncbi:GH92 family glycosyl hydrolase [candidate division KSB1 bacterium]|nr:GH92 family glycosyl hydrolase [candidate division KSB1 bacterium]
MKTITTVILSICILSASIAAQPKDKATLVNPFIGTGGHGHTFPGVSAPFGMVQLSPDTRVRGWDACSGYHYSDSTIIGFSHTHLSGTGAIDYGDILLMPTVGKLQVDSGDEAYPKSGYRSRFRHETEKAWAGFYSVALDDYGITVELTATKRAGFHKYIFPQAEEANIILDLLHGLGPDRVLEAHIEFIDNNEIAGLRRSQGWAEDQRVYFVAQFSKPFSVFGIVEDGQIIPGKRQSEGKNLKAVVKYSTTAREEILIKVGLSAVSLEGARKNLIAEIPDWNFHRVQEQAQAEWNNALGKIEIEGGTPDQQVMFYTALYHALLAPNLFMDVDGQYRGMDRQAHAAKDFENYTVFSLWDTFRATHPLFTIIERERTVDFIKTFLTQYEQGGLLPVWELAGNETGTMIGYHAVPVIADAYVKGIRDFDAAKALRAMKHSAEQDHLGLKYYREYGYVPAEYEHESVSKTLEYAYDDWCIAQMAKALGNSTDDEIYSERAQFYKNVFHSAAGFMRGKRNGIWMEPFSPNAVTFEYTEANAWQYSFFAPHDVQGLITLMGGNEVFINKLDELFSASSALTGKNQPDISGLLGQYAQGNEPSHHVAYLYNYAGAPWKTQEKVRQIVATMFTNTPEGLPGNEDCGQMSAWYVFSAMGFYPVCPGQDIYVIGSPLFEKVTINIDEKTKFVVQAKNPAAANHYIQSATLDGKPYQKSFLQHADIIKGGKLIFTMGPQPNRAWGAAPDKAPPSPPLSQPIVAVPYINAKSWTFNDSMVMSLECPTAGAEIYYTLDGSAPTVLSPPYRQPITLRTSTTVKAFAVKAGMRPSKIETAKFLAIPEKRKIQLHTSYSPLYAGGGDGALVDFIRGNTNFHSGAWQGYEHYDLHAVIDLGEVRAINRIAAGFLQVTGSWIFFPKAVEFSVSIDSTKFRTVATFMHETKPEDRASEIKEFSQALAGIQARYMRVFAKNVGVCPAWHYAAGGKSWIFVDEIVIE